MPELSEAPSATMHRASPILISNEIAATEWDAYVNSRGEASGYHLSGWKTVFERSFGHRTEYIAARRDGAIVGVLPLVEFRSWLFGRFMVSLPFVNYGGILASGDEVATALLDSGGAIAQARGSRYLELRHVTQRFPTAPCRRHKVGMLLELGLDVEAMWNGLDRKVRNQVRKAEKSGLICRIGGKEQIDQFYAVFATNMRDLGTPVYAKRFFQEVFRAFPDRASTIVVTLNDKTVAAGIVLRYRDRLEMPWASSLRAYRALCSNNLLYWTAITHAITSGCRIFDFGRSTPGEGTFHFKEQWGARPQPLCWEYRLLDGTAIPDHSPKNPKFSLAIELWKRLPVAVAGLLGPPIVRSIP